MDRTSTRTLPWLLGALAALPAVFAAAAGSLSTILQPIITLIGPNGYAGLYNGSTALAIDSVLITILFISIFSAVSKNRFGKAAPVIIGLIAGIGFGVFEAMSGFNLGQLGPLFAFVFFGLLIGFGYLMLHKVIENRLIAFLIPLTLVTWVIPQNTLNYLASVSPMSGAILSLTAGIGTIILIVAGIRAIGGGVGGGKLGNVQRDAGKLPGKIRQEEGETAALRKEDNALRSEISNAQRQVQERDAQLDALTQRMNSQYSNHFASEAQRFSTGAANFQELGQKVREGSQYVDSLQRGLAQAEQAGDPAATRDAVQRGMQAFQPFRDGVNTQFAALVGNLKTVSTETVNQIKQERDRLESELGSETKQDARIMGDIAHLEQDVTGEMKIALTDITKKQPGLGGAAFSAIQQDIRNSFAGYENQLKTSASVEDEHGVIMRERQQVQMKLEELKKLIDVTHKPIADADVQNAERLLTEFVSSATFAINSTTPDALAKAKGAADAVAGALETIARQEYQRAQELTIVKKDFDDVMTAQRALSQQHKDFLAQATQVVQALEAINIEVGVARIACAAAGVLAEVGSRTVAEAMNLKDYKDVMKIKDPDGKVEEYLQFMLAGVSSRISELVSKPETAPTARNLASRTLTGVEQMRSEIAKGWKPQLVKLIQDLEKAEQDKIEAKREQQIAKRGN